MWAVDGRLDSNEDRKFDAENDSEEVVWVVHRYTAVVGRVLCNLLVLSHASSRYRCLSLTLYSHMFSFDKLNTGSH